ncbi:MAG: hypothetical protein IJX54_00100, partial [Oscillospiraceae bacterium]|nr:hypothetical protein [Oscillospiraceae bacterium]
SPKVEVNNQYYAKGLNVEQKKYNVLLEQRRQIIDGIAVNQKSFHTSIFSILTFVSANYITTIITGGNMPPIFMFLFHRLVYYNFCHWSI